MQTCVLSYVTSVSGPVFWYSYLCELRSRPLFLTGPTVVYTPVKPAGLWGQMPRSLMWKHPFTDKAEQEQQLKSHHHCQLIAVWIKSEGLYIWTAHNNSKIHINVIFRAIMRAIPQCLIKKQSYYVWINGYETLWGEEGDHSCHHGWKSVLCACLHAHNSCWCLAGAAQTMPVLV